MSSPASAAHNIQQERSGQPEMAPDRLEDDAVSLDWLKQFERANGRALRVLHIGNIANNAYNNAKIQRSYGIEADVLCYDYYHIMGTPEWEDGGLTSPVDADFPDWWATNLGGFKRPEWFVQGPAAICIKYLNARGKRQNLSRLMWRWALEGEYWCLVQDRAWQTGVRRKIYNRRRGIRPYCYNLIMKLGGALPLLDPFGSIKQRLARTKSILRNRVIVPVVLVGKRVSQRPKWLGILVRVLRWLGVRRSHFMMADHRFAQVDGIAEKTIVSNFSTARTFLNIALAALHGFAAVFLHAISSPFRLASKPDDSTSRAEQNERVAQLISSFRQQEQDVSDQLWEQLGHYLREHTQRFGPALPGYDIIQGYSIDGIIPLSLGYSNFSCYEHGTLRDIPFEDGWLGLVCRLAYKNAPRVFVTNSDVMPSVDRLRLDRRKVCCLPHAFDDVKLDTFRMNSPSIVPDEALVNFFCPSRHHWRDQDPSLTKGSDLMLRAAAQVAAEGHKFRLILVEWGVDLEASKELIRELGLEGFVSWVSPMSKSALWAQYCRSHAVLDQFSLAALGGVGFETLALGRRLITKIDPAQLESFFGRAPPVMPATNQLEIVGSIRAVLVDPLDSAQIGAAGRQWIKDYHSARRIVALQARAYRDMLEEGTA